MKIRKHELPVVKINKGELAAWSLDTRSLEACDKLGDSNKMLRNLKREVMFKEKPSWRKLERLVSKMEIPSGFVLPLTIWKDRGNNKIETQTYLLNIR